MGLEWNNVQDTLKVCRGTNFEPQSQWKHRMVCSVVSSVSIDPLVSLSPFVIRGQITMKSVWQTRGQQWDSIISSDLNEQFID